MKNILSNIGAILFCCILHGQDFYRPAVHVNQEFQDGDSAFSFVSVEGGLHFGTDGLNSNFLTTAWKGGFLDSTFFEHAASQLLPVNRFGMQYRTGITYGMSLDSSSNSLLTFSLYRRSNISGKFTDDAFRLGFQGNTRFKGEEAGLSGTRFQLLTWSQLRVGYSTEETNHTTIEVAFSILAGHQYNESSISHGELFTDSQGLFVNGSLAADYYSSDTSNTSPFALNGFGTGVDVSWLYHKNVDGEQQIFKIECQDFGFINWNSKTIHRSVDTSFHYEGIDVTQYFSDPDFVAELPDNNAFIKSDTGIINRSTFLPAIIKASYMRSFFKGKTMMKASLAIPFWSTAMPLGSITVKHSFMKIKTNVLCGVAYGGYSRLQIPLEVSLDLIKNTALDMGVTNLLIFFDPTELAGCGAFVKLTYSL